MKQDGTVDNVVETHDLTKMFGDQIGIDSLNLEVPRGKIFGFIGPSGCGKTTTVRLLTGFYKPTSGSIRVLGKEPADFTQSDRERIGYLLQGFVLYPDLNVWENMNFAASFYGVSPFRSKRLNRLLEFVDLDGDKRKLARDLSGGMRRRLSLAATLIHDPEMLFLDEPTAGIDPILRRKFWDYFVELRDQGKNLFVTTQYVGEAAYCDLVGVMYEGRLLMTATPDELRKKAFGGELVAIKTSESMRYEQRNMLGSLPFVTGKVRVVNDQEVDVVVDEASTSIPLLMDWAKEHNLKIETIEEIAAPFDDVFVKLIEKETEKDVEKEIVNV